MLRKGQLKDGKGSIKEEISMQRLSYKHESMFLHAYFKTPKTCNNINVY